MMLIKLKKFSFKLNLLLIYINILFLYFQKFKKLLILNPALSVKAFINHQQSYFYGVTYLKLLHFKITRCSTLRLIIFFKLIQFFSCCFL